jgi:hypothetical protein
MSDVPTLTSATVANYCTINLLKNTASITSGNLDMAGPTTGGNYSAFCTQATASTLIYYEVTVKNYNTGTIGFAGFGKTEVTLATSIIGTTGTFGFVPSNSTWYSYKDATSTALTGLTGLAIGDIIMVAFNPSTGNAWVGKNGTWFNSGVPNTGTNPTLTGLTTGVDWNPLLNIYRDTGNYIEFSANFGQRPFSYTPPTGFKALNTYNLPNSTIRQGNKVMDATTYTGTGAARSVINAGAFKPDLVWIKSRSAAFSNVFYDSIRGVTNYLVSDSTAAQVTDANSMTAFNANGFSVGSSAYVNGSSANLVGWQWQAGQGSTSSNTSGSITSTVSVNATAGFSIVTYTGTGANATVGHGLGVAPAMMIVKNRSGGSDNWTIYQKATSSTPQNDYMFFTTAAKASASTVWQNTAPTSSVFYIGTSGTVNTNTNNFVAYCWAEIAGFSKISSYTGNGSADGPFVYTGFRPKFVMIKRSSATGDWLIVDTSRDSFNAEFRFLYPNLSNAEETSSIGLDGVSNGFKIRNTFLNINGSGSTYIYIAFAEHPFKNSNAR